MFLLVILGTLLLQRENYCQRISDYSKASDSLSNFKLVEEFGLPVWVGVLVRISDKYSRIVQLTNKALNGKEAEVKEESIKDTLVDLANYSVIAVILFEEWQKQMEKDE